MKRYVVLMASVMAAGCAREIAPAPEPDSAYIRGVVTARTAGGAIEVRASSGRSALVRSGPGTVVRGGSWESIRVGQTVTVWNSGPELRSLPPQVTADSVAVQ